MSVLMTVFFENGFSEYYFPAVDNRKYPITVSPYISGLDDEFIIDTQVWDGKWTVSSDKRYDLLKSGAYVESEELVPGLILEGTLKKEDVWFSIKIDESAPERTGFSKYILRRDKFQSLVIGSNQDADIVYNSRFVSQKHAEITFEGDNTYVTDNGSSNGTYLNGRLITGKTTVNYGDVIYIVGLKIVYLGDLMAVNNPDGNIKVKLLDPVVIPELTDEGEEDDYEKLYFLSTPRHLRDMDSSEIQIERCPQKQEQKPQPLIFISDLPLQWLSLLLLLRL